MKKGDTKSCGCLHGERTAKAHLIHGDAVGGRVTPEYQSWRNMRLRCYDRKNKRFKDYGGRGISVCTRWKNSYESFLADMGRRPTGRTLNRIDNDGDYTPENCEWATSSTQNKNRRKWRNTK